MRITGIIYCLIPVVLLSCSSSRYIETSLYFGQSKPDGGMITEKEWNLFKETEISKVFREGSSVTAISGNWYDTAAKALITEPTYMVSYYYKRSLFVSARIDSLRSRYKRAFNQQSVLRVDKKVKARF